MGVLDHPCSSWKPCLPLPLIWGHSFGHVRPAGHRVSGGRMEPCLCGQATPTCAGEGVTQKRFLLKEPGLRSGQNLWRSRKWGWEAGASGVEERELVGVQRASDQSGHWGSSPKPS